MKSQMKCSNCGAEISNINMSWNTKKQMLWMIPLMLIGFLPMARMTLFKANFAEELSISNFSESTTNGSTSILGTIKNTGSHNWSSINVKAEIYNESGQLVDISDAYIRTTVLKESTESFKMVLDKSAPEKHTLKLKISAAHTDPF